MEVISFRPEQENKYFFEKFKNIPKSKLINLSLKYYQIYLLRKELREGFSKQTEEDLILANSDLNDYISIINKYES